MLRSICLQLARRGGPAGAAAADAAPALASARAWIEGIDSSTTTVLRSDEQRHHHRHGDRRRSGCCPGVGARAPALSAPLVLARAFHSAAPPHAAFTMPSPTQLDAVMRVETLVDRTPDEIEDIWMTYHGGDAAAEAAAAAAAAAEAASGSDATQPPPPPPPPPAGEHCVGTVLSADEYKLLSARAKASPMFVLPLRKTVVRRRKEGEEGGAAAGAAGANADPSSSSPPAYLTLLLQWQLPLLLVTTVDEYRRLGPGAPPHLVATFYPQLAETKGLVLARGDLTGGGAGAGGGGKGGGAITTRAEARTVLELARALYTDGEMHRMVYRFNHDQGAFDFAELLRALALEGAAPVAAEEE